MSSSDLQRVRAQVRARYAVAGGQALAGGRPSCADGDPPGCAPTATTDRVRLRARMTDEMLDLARRHAAEAGTTNVEFLNGHIEAIPLPDASVDVVISNCVINLSGDKPAVFAEIARVLRPGGRLGVAELVTEDEADPAVAAAGAASVGAITGTLTTNGYRDELTAAGLVEATVTPMQQVAEATWSVLIHARRPTGIRPHRSDARHEGGT